LYLYVLLTGLLIDSVDNYCFAGCFRFVSGKFRSRNMPVFPFCFRKIQLR
jgi:hypothetical protein